MKFIQEISSNSQLLYRLIDNSLTKSSLRVHRKCNSIGNTVEEPDFIADLCINWTKELISVLELVLSQKYQIGITSVFCHQKPLADFGKTPRPELGDVLFVFKYTDNRNKTLINSLLLQAKRSSSPQVTLPSNDTQLELYENWPKFKYLRANHLTGKQRDIFPKTITQGAKYLLIDPSPVNTFGSNRTFTYGCGNANKVVSLNTELSSEIISFLQFGLGRTVDNIGNITEDWSQMIWDLLSVTKNKMTKRKNMGLGSFPRQNTSSFDGCHFMNINSMNNSFYSEIADNLNGEGNNNDNEEDGGVSTILIEINENE